MAVNEHLSFINQVSFRCDVLIFYTSTFFFTTFLIIIMCQSSQYSKDRVSTTEVVVAQMVKNPPVLRETWVWFLGWEDPLEKGTATHPSFLA